MAKNIVCTCNKETEIMEIHKLVLRVDTRTKDLHKLIMGNGQPGLFVEFSQLKGGLKFAKFLAGGGCLLAALSVLLTYMA